MQEEGVQNGSQPILSLLLGHHYFALCTAGSESMDTSHENIMVAQSNLELSLGLSSCGSETHPGALEQMMLVIKEKEKKTTKQKLSQKPQNPQPTKANK